MYDFTPRFVSQVIFFSISKGPIIEQYLAEEAVGLASSLNWEIIKGPYWNYMGKNIIIPTNVNNQ
jgi:hypothetical protein